MPEEMVLITPLSQAVYTHPAVKFVPEFTGDR